MTLRKRIVVCLDVQDGRLSGTVALPYLRDPGDPAEVAARYEQEGADEIAFLDRSASPQGKRQSLEAVRLSAERLTIPLTVGGGITGISDIGLTLRAGADKVSISSALVSIPDLLSEAAGRFGSEALVAGITARAERRQVEMLTRPEGAPIVVTGAASKTDWFRVFTDGGRTATQLDAVAWAKQCVERGAGEILLTTIAQNALLAGFDLEMTARVVEAVVVPVVANGGAGRAEHIRDVFLLAGADGAGAGEILHAGAVTVAQLKRLLHDAGIPVRNPEPRPELNEQQLP